LGWTDFKLTHDGKSAITTRPDNDLTANMAALSRRWYHAPKVASSEGVV
jgi:hypothetical protein